MGFICKLSVAVFAFLFSVSAFAAENTDHKPNKENPVSEASPANAFKLLDLFVFNPGKVATQPDTSFRATIKPDFNGIEMPENTLWFKEKKQLK